MDPNVKEFIIQEQVKSPLGVAKLTYIYIKMSWFTTKPSKYYGAWEERNQSLISSPLSSSSSSIHSISHSLSLLISLSPSLSITSLFPNAAFTVWLSCVQCHTPDLHPVSGTREVRAYPVPTCRHVFQILCSKQGSLEQG